MQETLTKLTMKKLSEIKCNSTEEIVKDHTDTSILGSINWYGVKTKLIVEEQQEVNAKQENVQNKN